MTRPAAPRSCSLASCSRRAARRRPKSCVSAVQVGWTFTICEVTIAFIKTHKDIDVAIASKVLGSSLAVESRTYDAQVSMLLDDGCFDPAAVEVIKDSFIDMGQLSQRPTTDQLLTTRFVPVKP
jgi:hypothetical protein